MHLEPTRSFARTRRSLALAAALLVLATSATLSAPVAGPGKTPPQTGSPASSGGEITSPGDPFLPPRPKPTKHKMPLPDPTLLDLTCDIGRNDGTAEVRLVNQSSETIPTGSTVTVVMVPGYINKSFILTADLPPGAAITAKFTLTDEQWQELTKLGSYDCYSKHAHRPQPGDDLTDSPFSPSLPAKSSPPWYLQGNVAFDCSIKRPSNSTFIIELHNSGDVTIPAGTKLIWKTANGQWMTYVLEADWPPGAEVEVPVPGTSKAAGWESWETLWETNPDCDFTKVDTGYFGPDVSTRGVDRLKPDPDKY